MQILVVEDHPIVRNALKDALRDLGEPVEVLEACTGEEARKEVAAHPDIELVLLDLGLPDCDDLDVLKYLRKEHRSLPVVVISGLEDDRALVQEVMEAGASGFIPKSSSAAIILNAIKLVRSGGKYFPEIMFSKSPAGKRRSNRGGRDEAAIKKLLAPLTPQEKRVLGHMLQGYRNKEIVRQITENTGKDIEESTVKAHNTNIFRKLGVTDSKKAITKCNQLGMQPKDLFD